MASGKKRKIGDNTFLYTDPRVFKTEAEAKAAMEIDLEEARAGSEFAHVRVESRFWVRLLNALARRMANEQDRMDVAQKAFYAFWKMVYRRKPIEDYFSLLLDIANKRRIDLLRQRTEEKKGRHDITDKEFSAIADGELALDLQLTAEADTWKEAEKRESLLAEYDAFERMVFDLRDRWGRSYEEIVAATGKSKAELQKVMEKIRKKFEDHGLGKKGKAAGAGA